MEHTNWTEVTISGQQCGVTSFKFDSILPDMNLRLVVQRTLITNEEPDAEPEGIFGTEYVFRCIVTNDWETSERDIIIYYNQRGASDEFIWNLRAEASGNEANDYWYYFYVHLLCSYLARIIR